MTPSPVTPALPGTVVVDARRAPAGAAARCAERLLAVVPAGTSVLVLTPRSTRLPAAVARRVRSVRGSADDHGARLAHEVSQDRAVLLVPASSTPTGAAWFAEAHARMAAEPGLVGVLGREGEELLAFPREVLDVDAPRTPWAPLPGLDVRTGPAASGVAGPHRTLSAVLIVKDEERVLESSLRALAPFVDEVVVYDTGSTDRTPAIAREHAHVVVEGYWDDDFGAARTRALAHASGDWVLVVDADEVVEGDPDALRRALDALTTEGALVSVVSTEHGHGTSGHTTRNTRLFQRAGSRYEGALHEQVVTGAGRPLRVSGAPLPIRAVHSGYSAVAMSEKGKHTRNVDISRAAYEAAAPGTTARADAASHYGRSLAGAGRLDAALHVLNTLLDQPASIGNCLQAARIAAPVLIGRRQWRVLDRWIALAELSGESAGQLATWRAGSLVGHAQLAEAAVVVDRLLADGGGTDLWGHPFDLDVARGLRAEIDLLLGDPEAAATRMREVLHRSPTTVNLQVLVNALGAIGLTMRDLIDEAPEAFLERALRDVSALHPSIALPWFSAQSAARPGDYRPLVAGNAVAARSTWIDALEWSTRAREAGLVGVCAMRDLAEDVERPVVERALCWGFLAEGMGEGDARERLDELLAPLDAEDQQPVREALRQHLPELALPDLPAPGTTGTATSALAPADDRTAV